MLKYILFSAILLHTSILSALPLQTFTDYVTAHPKESRKGSWIQLLARGEGTNDMYVIEADPVTGEIPVHGTFSATFTPNVSDFGATTSALRTASVLGNTTGQAAFNTGVRTAQTLRVTVATDDVVPVTAASLPLPSGAATETTLSSLNGKVADDYGVSSGAVRAAAQVGNATGVADFNTGAPGAQTLRTVLSSRSESVSTPLAAQLSNGSAALDYGTGGTTSATLRTAISTRSETVSTPLAAQLSNGTTAVDYGSGASGTATIRVVPSTRSEAATTPLAVRISDGSSFSVPSAAGRSYSDSVSLDYSGTNVTSGAWVQIIASTAAAINALTVFSSCGNGIELGTGALASETRKLLIPPGGIDGQFLLAIPASTRIAVRALSTTCSTGFLIITGFN